VTPKWGGKWGGSTSEWGGFGDDSHDRPTRASVSPADGLAGEEARVVECGTLVLTPNGRSDTWTGVRESAPIPRSVTARPAFAERASPSRSYSTTWRPGSQIVESYPTVTLEDVSAAVSYGAELARERVIDLRAAGG
jgi:hypothetical protein